MLASESNRRDPRGLIAAVDRAGLTAERPIPKPPSKDKHEYGRLARLTVVELSYTEKMRIHIDTS
jgi:hypothetical protein